MLWDLSNREYYYDFFQNFNFLEKMKRIFILLISLLIRWCAKSFARSYPVKQVEGNFCGQTGWLCKIDLPRIEKADYLWCGEERILEVGISDFDLIKG